MKKQFVLSFFGLFLLNLSVFGAGPWYVAKEDPNAADTLVEGRGTEALPFRTIQAALDNKDFEAGDTVYVKRGVYDEKMKVSTFSNYNMTNRVYVTKAVNLIAVDAKDETVIKGYLSPGDEADGMGKDSVRCMCFADSASGSVVKGFTFSGGRTTQDGGTTRANKRGGGVFYNGTDCGVTVVDCIFTDCRAVYGGAASGVVLIRCLVNACRGSCGAALDGGCAYASVIQWCSRRAGASSATADGIFAAATKNMTLVNCSILNNSSMGLFQIPSKHEGYALSAYNCILESNSDESDAGNTLEDCTTTESAACPGFQILSPMTDDYRPLADTLAIGLGKVEHVLALKELGVDEAYLKRDYENGEVDLGQTTLNAGAVQTPVAPRSAQVCFDADQVVDGRMLPKGAWLGSESWPVQYRVDPVVPEGETFYRFDRTKAGTFDGDRQPSSEYANLDGSVRIVPPPADVLAKQKYTAVYAKDEIWVDAAAEDASGTGSSGSPFKTIQDAVDAVSQDYTIIRVCPGDYKSGGHVWSNLMARVDFVTTQSKRPILLRAEEGPAVTAIWGAAGTTVDDDLPGCGEGAARCVLGTYAAVVQGFTLRDGHTLAGSEGTTYNTYGAATYQISSNFAQRFRVFDCVITNCVASDTLSYWTHTQRCRFVGNKAAYAVFRRGAHFADLVWNNVCNGDYLVVDSPYLYFCTFAENASSGTKTVGCWANGSHVFNSIFIGGAVTRSTDGVGNVVWTNGSTGSLDEHSKKVDPCLVDVPNGDCRPYCWSPALGWSKDDSTFYYFGGSDCTGGPLVFGSDGGISSGCYQSALPSGAITHYRNGSAVTNKIEFGEVLVKRIAPTEATHWWRGETSLYVGEMSVPWTGAGSLREFSASVDGAGTLSVLLNGETIGTVTAADGKKPFSFKPSDTGDTVRFAYSGEGCATLADFKSGAGLMLILR